MVHSCHACVNLSRLRSTFLSRRRCAVALHRHLCTHTCTHALTHNIPGTSYLCTYSCAYTHHSVPEPLDVEFGELKQGKMCLDTLSHHAGQGIGMFECHGMGGNQVSHHGNMVLYTWEIRKWLGEVVSTSISLIRHCPSKHCSFHAVTIEDSKLASYLSI